MHRWQLLYFILEVANSKTAPFRHCVSWAGMVIPTRRHSLRWRCSTTIFTPLLPVRVRRRLRIAAFLDVHVLLRKLRRLQFLRSDIRPSGASLTPVCFGLWWVLTTTYMYFFRSIACSINEDIYIFLYVYMSKMCNFCGPNNAQDTSLTCMVNQNQVFIWSEISRRSISWGREIVYERQASWKNQP